MCTNVGNCAENSGVRNPFVDCVGDCVVGYSDDDCVGDCVVGDSVGDCIDGCVVGDSVGASGVVLSDGL